MRVKGQQADTWHRQSARFCNSACLAFFTIPLHSTNCNLISLMRPYGKDFKEQPVSLKWCISGNGDHLWPALLQDLPLLGRGQLISVSPGLFGML